MRFSTLDTTSVQTLNNLAPIQFRNSFTTSSYKLTTQLKIMCHEPSTDDLIMTNQTFCSERNDIKRIFTGSKFLSLTEDLLRSHIEQCIHKDDLVETKFFATEPAKVDSSQELLPSYKLKEESMKTAPSLSPGRQDFQDLREREMNRVKKSMEELLTLAKLEEYIQEIDRYMDTGELYSVRACDLESKMQEVLPKMKIGHLRRLAVIILEQRGEYKRQGQLKLTENANMVKERVSEDGGRQDGKKITKLISLENWLESIKMQKYLQNFLNKGYDNYEFIILTMCNEFTMLNDMKLKNDIGIEDYEDRNQILTRLYRDRYNLINIDMDTQIGDRQDVLEGYREQVGCKGCSMF